MDWQALQEGLKKEAPPKDVKNDKDTAENTVVPPASVDVEQPSVMEDVINTAINSFKKDFSEEVNNDTTRLPRHNLGAVDDKFRPYFSNLSPGARRQAIQQCNDRVIPKFLAAYRSKKHNIGGRPGRDGFGAPSTAMSSKTPVGSDEKKTTEPHPPKDDDEVIAVDMATGIITTHNPKMLPFEGEADWVLVSSSESEDDTDTVGDWEMV